MNPRMNLNNFNGKKPANQGQFLFLLNRNYDADNEIFNTVLLNHPVYAALSVNNEQR